jgi:RNA polymerase sigma-70 factor (ECF subfamily)
MRARLALVGSVAFDSTHRRDNFGERVGAYCERLHHKAQWLTGNRDHADDLVQETVARALERRAQFRPDTNLEAWLVTILMNLFIDQIKHRKVERKAEPKLAMHEAAELDLDLTIAQISDLDIHEAIQTLEPELRDVVERCYVRELRYRVAAEELGIAIGTVATRLVRARKRLYEMLVSSRRKAVTT